MGCLDNNLGVFGVVGLLNKFLNFLVVTDHFSIYVMNYSQIFLFLEKNTSNNS